MLVLLLSMGVALVAAHVVHHHGKLALNATIGQENRHARQTCDNSAYPPTDWGWVLCTNDGHSINYYPYDPTYCDYGNSYCELIVYGQWKPHEDNFNGQANVICNYITFVISQADYNYIDGVCKQHDPTLHAEPYRSAYYWAFEIYETCELKGSLHCGASGYGK